MEKNVELPLSPGFHMGEEGNYSRSKALSLAYFHHLPFSPQSFEQMLLFYVNHEKMQNAFEILNFTSLTGKYSKQSMSLLVFTTKNKSLSLVKEQT